ncbi:MULTISPECIES: enoyl-CoA hydratase-related protein [Mesorhizobium]|uniref:Enoyl-CoA hydratase n=1 Tax=Mesorhizobium denitrificans TaxID=2294114 RepID=A0A371X6S8_9HYPH|nr:MULTISPECIES: enoyl-CoA hydratase-related protein [Mesorhizobium]RFC64916.1 enoyl-CoA hydratase [Mesorhizobium denitrificans]
MQNGEGLIAGVEGVIGEIRIDRPTRKNAITLAMWQKIPELIEQLSANARVIVLSGAKPDFSAGADISEFDTERGDARSARNYENANARAFAAIRNSPVPIIAAIRGICFGGGFGLAAAADLRIATPGARFAVPAARLGLAYPTEAMHDIVDSCGPQAARYLTMSGATIDANEALTHGFLLEIVEAENFDGRVREMAQRIAENAPLSIKASRLAIRAALRGDKELRSRAQDAGDETFLSADYAEGRAAFKEKRAPRFAGR